MRHHSGTNHHRQPASAARRWLVPAAVVGVTVIVLGTTASSTALVPPRTTTTTTTATTLPPRPTTTTTTLTAPTTTLPDPTTTASTSVVTSSELPITAPATTEPAPIPDPPTSPPPTVVTEPFIFSDPVIIDSEDPAIQPPVIVGLTEYCLQGFGYGFVVVQNVDLFHYPVPFEAVYQWTLSDGSTVVEDGSFAIAGWEAETTNLATHDVGTYTFTVTDADLGSSASIEVVIADCTNLPPA